MRWLLIALAALVVATPAAAQPDPLPPVNGIYNSADQVPGGLVLTGRFSEAWNGGAEGALTNTINAESFDGATLGTQWRVWCPSIGAPPTLVSNTVVGGTGDIVYETTYAGGLFWFSKNGPWSADNLVDFTGTVQSFVVVSTHQYVGGMRIGVRSNITMQGLFDQQYASWSTPCMEYAIQNGSIQGSTDMGPFPALYPPLLDDTTCAPGPATGAWGSVTQITMVIMDCVVPTEPTTWGRIKSQFR
jgi:hypothetical protein